MNKLEAYNDFLLNKIDIVEWQGFEVYDRDLHPSNFPHQNDIIKWSLRMGRSLVAASFGLGKTAIQCEIARLCSERTSLPFLMVCPLGVKYQFQEEDGPRLGMDIRYVRTDLEIREAIELYDAKYLITNYERIRDLNIDPRNHELAGVSLDEGSVLRSLGSNTTQIFNEVCHHIPYRFACTATPSPNNYREILNYADFLGIMDRGQALTRFFQRNPDKAGDLTIHPQHEKAFWLWVASWALFIYKPSDLGHSDEGYELPPLKVHWHRIKVDHRRAWEQVDNRGQHRLFLDAAGGVREAAAEKRSTIDDRIKEMDGIISENGILDNWIIWYHLEDERKAVQKALPEAKAVFGSQKIETREATILDFSRGEFQFLSTKPEIAGSGCNFQKHCHNNIFLGIDYRFQDFIQAIHRTHRFQQLNEVNVHIIFAESEDPIADTLRRKWKQHNKLVEKMQKIVREYGLTHTALSQQLKRKVGVDRVEYKSQLFTAVHNDCFSEIVEKLPDDEFDLIHTSIPFGNHYEYTTNYEDFGHNPTDAHFWQQMDFLIPELLRVLKPGRICAIHIKDRILYGHQTPTGFMELGPTSDECVMSFRKHNFLYEGRRTIVTDVVRENSSTYRLGWSEMCKDATKMGSGLPEYLLLFRKPPTNNDDQYSDFPVVKEKGYGKEGFSRARWQIDAHSFWQSNGIGAMDEIPPYDYEAHVKRLEEKETAGNLPASFFYEPPVSTSEMVWDDINFMLCLNANQSQKREQNHICPLPFDIVKRVIRLYSNPGDLVLDPFFGLGTVGKVALEEGRRAYGIELNPYYYQMAVKYCKNAEIVALSPKLEGFE